MTGITTLTGRFSSAVGTTHDASKVIPCIVILLLAAKPPSPEVVHDKAPVPPGSVFLYDHIDPSWPMMFRIASCCQLPASRPAPGLQARKGGRQIEKTHNTEGLGSENISMFFSNSIANRKGFLPRPALFRAWTLEAGREAGSYQGDAIRNLNGSVGNTLRGGVITDTGVFVSHQATYAMRAQDGGALPIYIEGFNFYAAEQVSTAPENRPTNVAVPVILYLGLPA